MSDFQSPAFDQQEIDAAAGIDARRKADDLPPVRPPSAGFIVQLFLVPAVIVLAIVGVYFTMRQLVSSNQDWQSLVAELRSTNPHRRWRGAHGLAQMLQADAQRGENGQQLARNPFVADELAGLMDELMRAGSQTDDDIEQRAFLARTLGWLDAPGTVLPILQRAIGAEHHVEVRKNAIASIAQIAGRAAERGTSLAAPSLTADLTAVSSDTVPLIRQMAAYVLGLIPGDNSRKQLAVLLQDGDGNTRLNAAIGLARQQSAAGLEVFRDALADPDRTFADEDMSGPTPEKRHQEAVGKRFELLVGLVNTIKALVDISSQLSDEQRAQVVELLTPIADHHSEARIRLEAKQALRALER